MFPCPKSKKRFLSGFTHFSGPFVLTKDQQPLLVLCLKALHYVVIMGSIVQAAKTGWLEEFASRTTAADVPTKCKTVSGAQNRE